jgi:hypothetical protein
MLVPTHNNDEALALIGFEHCAIDYFLEHVGFEVVAVKYDAIPTVQLGTGPTLK